MKWSLSQPAEDAVRRLAAAVGYIATTDAHNTPGESGPDSLGAQIGEVELSEHRNRAYRALATTALVVLLPLAANDFICWMSQYGVFHADSIASISGTTVTMTSNLPTKSEAGAIVYCFGEIARATNETLRFTVSSENDWTDIFLQGGAPGQKTRHARSGQNDPLLIHIDNATNAGFLHQVVALYADAADVTM